MSEQPTTQQTVAEKTSPSPRPVSDRDETTRETPPTENEATELTPSPTSRGTDSEEVPQSSEQPDPSEEEI